MRLLSLALILACAFSLRATEVGKVPRRRSFCIQAAERVKPADWDDALDGEWEPPKEDDPANDLPPTPPYEPPPQVCNHITDTSRCRGVAQEQYLSQGPDAWKNTFDTVSPTQGERVR